MEDDKKYTKLLAEYSKLRTQAKVLKNAVLEEKNRVSVLQESLRNKDQNLRRFESELDSVNFRNKQLEHRVSSLQDDLQITQKSNKGNTKANKMRDNQLTGTNSQMDPIIIEELQKRIMENAQLASAISDKDNEIEMYINRIKDLELQLSKHLYDHSEAEKKLRKEYELLSSKHAELEAKVIEATSQLGSDGDGVSLASDSTIPIHMAAANLPDERIAYLEKELHHYRTQYELLKINDALRMDEHLNCNLTLMQNNNNQPRRILSSQSSTSSSMSNTNNHSTFVNGPTSSHSSGSKSSPSHTSKSMPGQPTTKSDDDLNEPVNRDQLVYEYFSKRFDELFHEKCKAESKVINYMTECESLKCNVEILMDELSEKEKKLIESQVIYARLEEDFLTTRVNYEDQICVLTDQVLHLSDQLANAR